MNYLLQITLYLSKFRTKLLATNHLIT